MREQRGPVSYLVEMDSGESILEQKAALAAYAADNNIQHLTANQLEMARRMVLVLSPVVEITQAISKETATLSIVIPHI